MEEEGEGIGGWRCGLGQKTAEGGVEGLGLWGEKAKKEGQKTEILTEVPLGAAAGAPPYAG